MKYLRIIGLSTGEPSPFDGQFVKVYDPTYWPAGKPYDGGLLKVTSNHREARAFPDAGAAMECWRQSFGIRPDGKPNRPLTAFTVEIADAGDSMLSESSPPLGAATGPD